MPHTVWNLGSLVASARVQPRQFVAGIEPGQGTVIGRRREPKPMIVILDAWLEVNDFEITDNDDGFHELKYSLALGKDPLNDAQLLPVGRVWGTAHVGDTAQRQHGSERLFKAQGTMWAAKLIGIDIQEFGAVGIADVDVHLDWTVAFVDWWTWFIGWNNLEASPDGNLVDGERSYA